MFRTSKRRARPAARSPLTSGATGPAAAPPVAPPGEPGGGGRGSRREAVSRPVVPSWQSTVIGLALLAGVLVTFAGVTNREGIDAGLMSWAALGPLVGIVTGAMTTYFFTAQGTATERAERLVMQQRLSREQHSRLVAESRLHLLMGLAGESTLNTAAAMSPALFADVGRAPSAPATTPGATVNAPTATRAVPTTVTARSAP